MVTKHIIRFRSNETADYLKETWVKGERQVAYSFPAEKELTECPSKLPIRFQWDDATVNNDILWGNSNVQGPRFHMRNVRHVIGMNAWEYATKLSVIYRCDHVVRYGNAEYGTRVRSNTLNFMLKSMSSKRNNTRFKASYSYRSEKVWRVSFQFWNRSYVTELNTANAERAVNAAMLKWPTLFDGHVTRICVRRER